METPWCENIKVVQDSMAFWPSDGFTALLLFGLSGLMTCYASWRYWQPNYWVWLGPFMVVAAAWYFQEINTERHEAIRVFKSDRKTEFIGKVSDQQISFVNGGKYDVDAPWGFFNNPSSSRSEIWFKVGGQRVKTDVFRFTFRPGNKCNWWSCDLEPDDRVKVSVDKESYGLLPDRTKMAKPYLETYYINPLRIERCDDK